VPDAKDKKPKDKGGQPLKPAGNRGGSSGGKWLLLLAVTGLLAGWWMIYQPLRPDSTMLPPTAGITNRVPETLTNLAASVQRLTNYIPSNILAEVPWPASSTTGKAAQVTSTNALPQTNAPLKVAGLTNAPAPLATNLPPPIPPDRALRQPQNVFELQLALDRQGISPGSLDGVMGSQTRTALRAFQKREGLFPSGDWDAATRAKLWLRPPAYTNYTVTEADLARLRPLSNTWLGKSQQDRLDYESILELAAERGHAHPDYLRRINPGRDWSNLTAGASITIPLVPPVTARGRAAEVRIRLSEKTLQVFDQNGRLLAHFPCSIARFVEKRPLGELRVEKAAENPNYRFDPAIFPESAEARRIGRPLMVQPGPNNPVGVAWIGLDRPGYGIHGTPAPEAVGRTESHGCFRLANWNAQLLVKLVWKGMPVIVEP